MTIEGNTRIKDALKKTVERLVMPVIRFVTCNKLKFSSEVV